MNRSRVVLAAAGAVVGLGVLTAVGVLALAPARAAVGPLPAEGLALPADARFLIGVDVKRLVASPLYARFAKGPGAMRPDAFKELEARTGIDPERDVKQLLVAGGLGGRSDTVALVLGDFDPPQIAKAIETANKATSKKVAGTTVYRFGEGRPSILDHANEGRPSGTNGTNEGRSSASALAVLDAHGILLGSATAVEATLASRSQGQASLRGNATLMDLLAAVRPGSTFWMVGDQSLLANMPGSVPGAGGSSGSSASVMLPKLNSLTLTGDLDPILSIDVVGGATDAAAASSLADIVRGFVALATLQAAQKPELQGLPGAFSVTTETNHVKLSGRLPHELVEAWAKPKPKPAAPAHP